MTGFSACNYGGLLGCIIPRGSGKTRNNGNGNGNGNGNANSLVTLTHSAVVVRSTSALEVGSPL